MMPVIGGLLVVGDDGHLHVGLVSAGSHEHSHELSHASSRHALDHDDPRPVDDVACIGDNQPAHDHDSVVPASSRLGQRGDRLDVALDSVAAPVAVASAWSPAVGDGWRGLALPAVDTCASSFTGLQVVTCVVRLT